MDEQLLSQEEINLLLKTLGKEEKKEVKADKEVQPFDVSALEHIYAGGGSLANYYERAISPNRHRNKPSYTHVCKAEREIHSFKTYG
jgi:hypothetical protein